MVLTLGVGLSLWCANFGAILVFDFLVGCVRYGCWSSCFGTWRSLIDYFTRTLLVVAFPGGVLGSQSTAVLSAIGRCWICTCSFSCLHPSPTSFWTHTVRLPVWITTVYYQKRTQKIVTNGPPQLWDKPVRNHIVEVVFIKIIIQSNKTNIPAGWCHCANWPLYGHPIVFRINKNDCIRNVLVRRCF